MQATRTPRQFLSAWGSRSVMLMSGDQRRIEVYRAKAAILSDFAAA